MCDDKCNARGCNSVAQNGYVNASTAISPANACYVAAGVAAFAIVAGTAAAKDRRVWRSFVPWVELKGYTLTLHSSRYNFHEISASLDFVSRYNSSFDPTSALALLSQLFSIVLTEPLLAAFNTVDVRWMVCEGALGKLPLVSWDMKGTEFPRVLL